MNFSKQIIGIMAATEHGVIGCDNDLPWCYPEELEHFRKMTESHVIIMGRKTYDTTPQLLMSNRHAVVLSRNGDLSLENAKVVTSLNDCLAYIDGLSAQCKIFMIGGAQIAHLFLANGLISSFVLTKIHKPYPGDVCLDLSYFKTWSRSILKRHDHYTLLSYHLRASLRLKL